MALGNTAVTNLKREVLDISDVKQNVLNDCWNTFQYVVNRLESWADETTVGNELKTSLMQLVDSVESVNNELDKLCAQMNEFIQSQETTNRG